MAENEVEEIIPNFDDIAIVEEIIDIQPEPVHPFVVSQQNGVGNMTGNKIDIK